MTTKITIDKHLAEYCIGKWGDGETKIVSFPTNTDLYITIYDLLIKRPIDCQTDNGTLEIKLPVRRANMMITVLERIRKSTTIYLNGVVEPSINGLAK